MAKKILIFFQKTIELSKRLLLKTTNAKNMKITHRYLNYYNIIIIIFIIIICFFFWGGGGGGVVGCWGGFCFKKTVNN